MKTIERDIVAAMIISADGKIFLGKKDSSGGGVYVDCWHIPGGGVREGENHIEAAIREVKEETGIDVSGRKIELIDDEGCGESEKILKSTGEKVMCKMCFRVYEVRIQGQKANEIRVSLDDDLSEYKWVDFDDLGKYKLTPPGVELFTKLGYLS